MAGDRSTLRSRSQCAGVAVAGRLALAAALFLLTPCGACAAVAPAAGPRAPFPPLQPSLLRASPAAVPLAMRRGRTAPELSGAADAARDGLARAAPGEAASTGVVLEPCSAWVWSGGGWSVAAVASAPRAGMRRARAARLCAAPLGDTPHGWGAGKDSSHTAHQPPKAAFPPGSALPPSLAPALAPATLGTPSPGATLPGASPPMTAPQGRPGTRAYFRSQLLIFLTNHRPAAAAALRRQASAALTAPPLLPSTLAAAAAAAVFFWAGAGGGRPPVLFLAGGRGRRAALAFVAARIAAAIAFGAPDYKNRIGAPQVLANATAVAVRGRARAPGAQPIHT